MHWIHLAQDKAWFHGYLIGLVGTQLLTLALLNARCRFVASSSARLVTAGRFVFCESCFCQET